MTFSKIKLSHPSREQTQISGLNPNVALVMCQSFEGMKGRRHFSRRQLS